jgi:hypothetical protein
MTDFHYLALLIARLMAQVEQQGALIKELESKLESNSKADAPGGDVGSVPTDNQ